MSPNRSTLASDPSTPDQLRGQEVTDSIRHITQRMTDDNDGDEPASTRSQYLKFTPEQLSQLIIASSTPGSGTTHTLTTSPTSTAVIASSAPAYATNAKYEEISCKPIKPSSQHK
jgi:hypothetical protein